MYIVKLVNYALSHNPPEIISHLKASRASLVFQSPDKVLMTLSQALKKKWPQKTPKKHITKFTTLIIVSVHVNC